MRTKNKMTTFVPHADDRFLNHPRGYVRWEQVKYLNGYRVRSGTLIGTGVQVAFNHTVATLEEVEPRE